MKHAHEHILLGGAIALWLSAIFGSVLDPLADLYERADLLVVGGAGCLTVLWYLTRYVTSRKRPIDQEAVELYGQAMFQLGQHSRLKRTSPERDLPPLQLVHALRSTSQTVQPVKIEVDGIPMIIGVQGGVTNGSDEEAATWAAVQRAVRKARREKSRTESDA